MDLAQRATQDQDFAAAALHFGRVIANRPSAQERERSLLGLARSRRALGNYAAAIRAYAALLEGAAGHRDEATNGGDHRIGLWMERGACEAELLRWEAAARSFDQALQVAEGRQAGLGLGIGTQLEIFARLGLALFHLERFEAAENTLERGVALYSKLEEADRRRLGDPYFFAMCNFYLGAIDHRRFLAIRFHLPESRMAEELRQKIDWLEKAEAHYHDTVRVRHVFWVSAAGWQLGQLFESFYDSMMQSPVPPELSPAQRAIFYTELKKKLRPVVMRAIWVLEKNLSAARKLGYRTEFVQQSQRRLEFLQSYLLSEHATGPFAPPPLAALAAPGDAESRGEGRDAEENGNTAGAAWDEPVLDAIPEFLPEPTPL